MTKHFTKTKASPSRLNSNLTHAAILSAMLDQPQSTAAVTALGGMHYQTTRIFLRALHHAGVIHIAGWCRNTAGDHGKASSGVAATGHHPLYLVGRQPDTAKPSARTAEERLVRQRERRREAALLRGPLPKKNPGPKPGTPVPKKPAARVAPAPWGQAVATTLRGNLWGTLQ